MMIATTLYPSMPSGKY